MITLKNVYGPENHVVIELLYQLLLERPQEANISHREAPPYYQHASFVRSRPYQHWYLIGADTHWVGSINSTERNEIGIAILKAHQGKGYAAAAITQFVLDHRPLPAIPSQRSGRWLANVAPENTPSHALFKRLGWKPVQITYTL